MPKHVQSKSITMPNARTQSKSITMPKHVQSKSIMLPITRTI